MEGGTPSPAQAERGSLFLFAERSLAILEAFMFVIVRFVIDMFELFKFKVTAITLTVTLCGYTGL
jgi:hypothetical protein